ncbi:MAG: flap endonuclease, partial [Actinomycetota bacterium]|nr:flap endonuclease [Actinomycetota bacterium]
TEPADPDGLADLVDELGIGASVSRLATALGWPAAGPN